MSITRLQQARQMYALGQRVGGIMGSNNGSMLVTPTRDGSRPGYYGPDAGHENDPGHGSNAPGGGEGVDTQNMQDYMTDYATNVGKTAKTTGGFKGDGFFGGMVNTVKDYIKGGGLIGTGIRGITGLVNKFTGPKATEYGNLDIPGYNMLNIAGPVVGPTPTEGGDGVDNQQLYANQYPTIPPVVSEEEGITTLINNPDFLQRYRVKNPYRQDKQGQLDPAIIEMINKLYT